MPLPFHTVSSSAFLSIAIEMARRTLTLFRLSRALFSAITTSPVVVPWMTVYRLVSLNWSMASGACRFEITSRSPDSIAAFMALASAK